MHHYGKEQVRFRPRQNERNARNPRVERCTSPLTLHRRFFSQRDSDRLPCCLKTTADFFCARIFLLLADLPRDFLHSSFIHHAAATAKEHHQVDFDNSIPVRGKVTRQAKSVSMAKKETEIAIDTSCSRSCTPCLLLLEWYSCWSEDHKLCVLASTVILWLFFFSQQSQKKK